MGTNVTNGVVRGLIVPDPRLTRDSISASLSSFTQAGPLPGVPEPQADTEMVLESSGTQSSGKQLRIHATKAGQPVPDGGSFLWRDTSEPAGGAEPYRGWDGPHALAYFETYDFTTTAGKWKHPHAITLADGTIVVVILKLGRYVTCLTRSPTANTWAEVTIHDNAAAYTYAAHPTVLALPSGRLLVFFWKEDATLGENQVRMHYSDDAGATWALANRACLASALAGVGVTITPHAMRAAYLNGQVLLVAQVEDSALVDRSDVLYQYASVDLGASFTLVDSWAGTDDTTWAAYPSLFAANGEYVLHYLTRDTATTGSIVPYQRRIANAYSLLSGATAELACQSTNPMKWGIVSGGPPSAFTSGELTSWVDEDGVYYMAGCDFDAGALRECYVQRSIDKGVSWAAVGAGSAPGFGAAWWRGDDASTRPAGFAGTAQGGRAVIVGHAEATATSGPSLSAAYLGGYTTVCLPQLYAFPSPKQRVAWEKTWVGYDLPENTGGIFTLGVAGAPVAVLGIAGLAIAGGAGDVQSYTLTTNPTSTNAQGMACLVDLEVALGGGFVTLESAVAGPSAYQITAFVTTTSIRLRDVFGAVDIATIAITPTAGVAKVQILLAVGNDGTGAGAPNNGQCQAWYRYSGSGTDRKFTAIGSSAALVQGGATLNAMQWGTVAGAAFIVTFRQVCYTYGAYAGANLYTVPTINDLQGRNFAPSPVFVNDGTKIAAVDGPAFYADTWHVNTRYEYPIENIFTPSPAQEWRSVGTADPVSIVLEYDATLNQETPRLSPLAALGLLNINFREFELDGYDKDSATWVSLGQGFASDGQQGLQFTRQGDAIIPSAGTTPGAKDWFTLHALAGSYVALRDAAGVVQNVRRIRTNGEGAFNNTATKQARIFLEGAAAGDLTGAALATAEIWARDVALVSNNPDKYTRIRIYIPAQTTAEGYFRIGTAVPGHVVTFARQYSRGRALSVEPNYQLTTARSGTRRARKLGDARRAVEFAWTDGVDVTQATGNFPSADYVTGYVGGGAPAVGSPHDTPYTVAGVAELLAGATTPVIYLPGFALPNAVDVPALINNRNRMLYARLVSTVRLESRLGSEWSGKGGELFNVATITLEEEV